jgi:hypothetical protein
MGILKDFLSCVERFWGAGMEVQGIDGNLVMKCSVDM